MTTDTVPAAAIGLPSLTRRAALVGIAAGAATMTGTALVVAAEPHPDAAIFDAFRRIEEARQALEEIDAHYQVCRARYFEIRPAIPDAMRVRGLADLIDTPAKFIRRTVRDQAEPAFIIPEGWRWLSRNPPCSAAGTPFRPAVAWIARGLEAAERWEAADRGANELTGLGAALKASNEASDALGRAEDDVIFTPARTLAGLALQATVVRANMVENDRDIEHFLGEVVRLAAVQGQSV